MRGTIGLAILAAIAPSSARGTDGRVASYARVGRVHDAIELAMRDSGTRPGRRTLLELLVRFELWDELAGAAATPALARAEGPEARVCLGRAQALAHLARGRLADADAAIADVRAAAARAGGDMRRQAQAALVELAALRARANGPQRPAALPAALEVLPTDRQAVIAFELGDRTRALALARAAVEAGEGEAPPLALLADLAWRAGHATEAQEAFRKLRPLSATVDLDVPLFRRLVPIAQSLALPADWRIRRAAAAVTTVTTRAPWTRGSPARL